MQQFCEGQHLMRADAICTGRRIARSRPASVSRLASTDTTDTSYPQPTEPGSLRAVEAASKRCRACDLWKTGTQTVFGEGPRNASAMFVGEQPGDQEDKAGEPFVGPAGRLLDEGLEAAGIDRSAIYVTNAVKHFKWRPQGKRRLHEKPNGTEIR